MIDEPDKSDLWGTIASKIILEQKIPSVIPTFPLNNLSVAQYYDRFSTVVWTDDYPLMTDQPRDPWSVGKWCRDVSEISNKRHWFCPQAFGSTDSWEYRKGSDYSLPSKEEFRLMMNLALANGVKAFHIFNDHGYAEWISLSDMVGNPTPLMKDAAILGYRCLTVGQLMLDARPVFNPQVAVTGDASLKHGISVGAMVDPNGGPLYLVATNEDLTSSQGGRAALPAQWIGPEKSVYDLYSLRQVSPKGANAFDVRPLNPGDGRIYMLATDSEFAAARTKILRNQVEEKLRVQNADRIIAQNWGLNLKNYDSTVRLVRKLLEAGQYDKAVTVCSERAESAMKVTLDNNIALVTCRSKLLNIRGNLGKAIPRIYRGYKIMRPGQEQNDPAFCKLAERYDDLRQHFLRGEKAGLLAQITELDGDTRKLLAAVEIAGE